MTDAIQATVAGFQSLADGTIRLKLDVHQPDNRAALDSYCEIGAVLALARLKDSASLDRPYGQEAKALKLSGFFRMPSVWAAVGTDAEFLDWLRTQPCAVCDKQPPSEAAHVRRLQNGAGTALKPAYAAIAMCHDHHAQSHTDGQDAVMPREQWDRLRIKYLEEWCWESLREQLGFQHWYEIEPPILASWAREKGVSAYLPGAYDS